MTRARAGSRRTNSMCFRLTFAFVVRTTPAPRETPDSMVEASARAESNVWPEAAARICASIRACSSWLTSPSSSIASTKKRRPNSVGRRPADVCGAKIRPECSRSAMTLRIEAGDSAIGRMRARFRDPTGSPVVEIALDDLPEDLPGTLVEGGERLHGLAVREVGTGVCHEVILWSDHVQPSRADQSARRCLPVVARRPKSAALDTLDRRGPRCGLPSVPPTSCGP